MIEIAVALSVASKTFEFVKSAVDKGHEIKDLQQSICKFWDSKESILEASLQNEYTSIAGKLFGKKSVESQAMEIALAKNKAYELEKQLRELFIYSGQSHVYEDMMKERRRIREARLAEAKRVAENRKFWLDVLTVIGAAVVTAGLLIIMISTVVTK